MIMIMINMKIMILMVLFKGMVYFVSILSFKYCIYKSKFYCHTLSAAASHNVWYLGTGGARHF